MKCDECGAKVIERVTTNDVPYKYTLSGLENVYLIGISVQECTECEEVSPTIPKIPQLHSVIAKSLVEKEELLSGKEVRFLRKNAGFSAKRLSALLLLDPSHLSRVENGKHESFSPQTDKLIRVIVTIGEHQEEARKLLLEAADLINEGSCNNNIGQVLKLEKDDWVTAAA